MFSALDVSTSALVAQRFRMDTVSNNLANISTTHNERGEPSPYQPRLSQSQPHRMRGVESENSERVNWSR